ncbi:hypothetical protein LF887_05380 [Chryseobacterium sp. MEBOG06]|uniref:hypothetical protein n=1 Tax=unclassified Chryseobacterium TaxID=2593645 RepID=UPI001F32B781|nr:MULTISPECIES: hypothetical protein [unclassified Chryseobacterium]UKB85059.1 hypothetical protein LF887_05380 [Chryseobacterium sp. MEBOG06]
MIKAILKAQNLAKCKLLLGSTLNLNLDSLFYLYLKVRRLCQRGIHSIDKSLIEKVTILENLDEEERKGIYSIIDGLSTKQKLKQTLSNALAI